MLNIFKNKHFLSFFVSIQQIIVGILLVIVGFILIFLPAAKNYVTIDSFLQTILLLIGLPTFIFGVYILYKQYRKDTVIIENNTISDNSIVTESYEITNYKIFVDNLNINEFDEISLFVHTGRNSLEILRQKIISDNFTDNIDIKILLKYPYTETTNRFIQIENCLITFQNEIRNRNRSSIVDVRYYSGLPYFHAILCKYKNKEQYQSYISYYKWNRYKTIACNTGTAKIGNSDLFLVTKSWFEHLFSKKNLHTIVFDLDDTIIDSYDLQIMSWEFLLESIFDNQNELSSLREKIKTDITEESYERYIENMFLRTTNTDERFDCIFHNLSVDELQQIKKIRFEKREELTIDEAPLFTECQRTLRILSRTYNLVIISATSENLVKRILDKYDLHSYFSFYLGVRDNQVEAFDKAEDKTPYLIKTSNLVGVPFDRIAFVGDSLTDFKAAKQLNMKFISANMVATKLRLQPPSFITGHNGLEFNTYKNDCLLNIIEQNFN